MVEPQGFSAPLRQCQQNHQARDRGLIQHIGRQEAVQCIDGCGPVAARRAQIGLLQQRANPLPPQGFAALSQQRGWVSTGPEIALVEEERLREALLLRLVIGDLPRLCQERLKGVGIDPEPFLVSQGKLLSGRIQQALGENPALVLAHGRLKDPPQASDHLLRVWQDAPSTEERLRLIHVQAAMGRVDQTAQERSNVQVPGDVPDRVPVTTPPPRSPFQPQATKGVQAQQGAALGRLILDADPRLGWKRLTYILLRGAASRGAIGVPVRAVTASFLTGPAARFPAKGDFLTINRVLASHSIALSPVGDILLSIAGTPLFFNGLAIALACIFSSTSLLLRSFCLGVVWDMTRSFVQYTFLWTVTRSREKGGSDDNVRGHAGRFGQD